MTSNDHPELYVPITEKDFKREIQRLEKKHKKDIDSKDNELSRQSKSHQRKLKEKDEKISKLNDKYEKERERRKVLEKKIEEHGLRRRVKNDDGAFERRGKRRTYEKKEKSNEDEFDDLSDE